MLSQIESKNAIQELDKEIEKLQQENELIQNEWFKQKIEMEGDINTIRQKTQERKERLLQYKEKVSCEIITRRSNDWRMKTSK